MARRRVREWTTIAALVRAMARDTSNGLGLGVGVGISVGGPRRPTLGARASQRSATREQDWWLATGRLSQELAGLCGGQSTRCAV